MPDRPVTLRDVLMHQSGVVAADRSRGGIAYQISNIAVVIVLTVLPIWWFSQRPDANIWVGYVFVALLVIWALGAWLYSPRAGRTSTAKPRAHFLLAGDHHGFMGDLHLDRKTAVFDGSNIYHLGLANDLGGRPLRLTAKQLRAEDYRIVCFFDANIFYTMLENGNFAQGQVHSIDALVNFFGLHGDEIYVVPSGVQADKYVLSCLKHLPFSFAVTNDQFRDYAKIYSDVMTGDQWRKGVYITGNEVRLRHHKFETPARLAGVG